MSAVKKVLKALMKTIRHPVQQANDELEGKKFWTKDIAPKKKNEEVDEGIVDKVKSVFNKNHEDNSFINDSDYNAIHHHIIEKHGTGWTPHSVSRIKGGFKYQAFHRDDKDFKHPKSGSVMSNKNESVGLDEAKVHNDAEYKKAAKLAAEMTAYANSLKNNDEKASEAHLKAIDAQWAAYQAGLAIGHKDRLTHLSIGNKHLDKTGLHDLDEDAQAAGAITAHVNKVHRYMKAENAKKSNPESRGAVLNRTNQALKAAHGHNAPQITRLKDDDDTPANITAGKLTHHTPEQVIMRHYGQTASASTHAHSNNTANKTNEGINMNLTPVQKKIRQIVENFTSREELDEAFDGTHVIIEKPGHFLHGKKAAIFHHHADGSLNVQVRTGRGIKDNEIHNVTVKPHEYKTLDESVELDENTEEYAAAAQRAKEVSDAAHNAESSGHNAEETKDLHFHAFKRHTAAAHLAPNKALYKMHMSHANVHGDKLDESVELDEVSDKLKGTPWDPAYKTKTQPKSNRTITKFKAPGSSGAEVTQVRHDNDSDDVYDEDGNLIKKTEEPKEKRGRGRPAGAKSGARTHGSDGGVKNQAVYGGHQFSMPNFGKK